jgi:hypothetical protein
MKDGLNRVSGCAHFVLSCQERPPSIREKSGVEQRGKRSLHSGILRRVPRNSTSTKRDFYTALLFTRMSQRPKIALPFSMVCGGGTGWGRMTRWAIMNSHQLLSVNRRVRGHLRGDSLINRRTDNLCVGGRMVNPKLWGVGGHLHGTSSSGKDVKSSPKALLIFHQLRKK